MVLFIIFAALLLFCVIMVIVLTIKAEQLSAQVENVPDTSIRYETQSPAAAAAPKTTGVPRAGDKGRTEASDRQPARNENPGISIGVVYNQGARPSQQDNYYYCPVCNNSAVLAVVADGMGGLEGGERVSGRIVQCFRSSASQITPENANVALPKFVEAVSENVNAMLGPDGIYKSGSTLLSVIAEKNRYYWATVGDSRIYHYRGGVMKQINREHNQLNTEWMPEVQAGRIDLQAALKDPAGKKLTSFIGMGNLRYVERSTAPVEIKPGDRILLMSDGVFNTLSDRQMAQILESYTNVKQAASVFESQILAAHAKGQDNFTAVILGF